ncbi:hypothetical protein ACFLY7_00115 [Patescibacteria group bacterium]
MDQNTTPTKEEIAEFEKLTENYGKKIGYYLNELDMPDELKNDLIKTLPSLKPEEIDGFVKTLEDKLIDQKILEENPEYQKEMKKIDEETLSKLEELLAVNKK